jgi:hypothetical protein
MIHIAILSVLLLCCGVPVNTTTAKTILSTQKTKVHHIPTIKDAKIILLIEGAKIRQQIRQTIKQQKVNGTIRPDSVQVFFRQDMKRAEHFMKVDMKTKGAPLPWSCRTTMVCKNKMWSIKKIKCVPIRRRAK